VLSHCSLLTAHYSMLPWPDPSQFPLSTRGLRETLRESTAASHPPRVRCHGLLVLTMPLSITRFRQGCFVWSRATCSTPSPDSPTILGPPARPLTRTLERPCWPQARLDCSPSSWFQRTQQHSPSSDPPRSLSRALQRQPQSHGTARGLRPAVADVCLMLERSGRRWPQVLRLRTHCENRRQGQRRVDGLPVWDVL
jgi:hypothetical protein